MDADSERVADRCRDPGARRLPRDAVAALSVIREQTAPRSAGILAGRTLFTMGTMNALVEEIEKDPRAYLDRVLEGETVVVFEKDQPVAEMRPLAKRAGKRPIGLAKGDFVVPDDFNDPLPDDVLQLFEGE
jgi:antitoxin (DNA-binding transcriptional repressor) of toxin-antitoxin stability system